LISKSKIGIFRIKIRVQLEVELNMKFGVFLGIHESGGDEFRHGDGGWIRDDRKNR
jgi:hypothetical protein